MLSFRFLGRLTFPFLTLRVDARDLHFFAFLSVRLFGRMLGASVLDEALPRVTLCITTLCPMGAMGLFLTIELNRSPSWEM
jgi:hypothetical protein